MKTETRMHRDAIVDMIKDAISDMSVNEKLEMMDHLSVSLARHSLDIQLREVCKKLTQPIQITPDKFDPESISIMPHGGCLVFSYLSGCEFDLDDEEIRPAAEIMGCGTGEISVRLEELTKLVQTITRLNGREQFPLSLQPVT